MGLHLNPSKCTIWGPGAETLDLWELDGYNALAADHIGKDIPVTPYTAESGITVLGVPIDALGGRDQTAHKWETVAQGARELLTNLGKFPDNQIKHCLLRYCLDGCKVMHLLRSSDATKAWETVQDLSHNIREATSELLGGPH